MRQTFSIIILLLFAPIFGYGQEVDPPDIRIGFYELKGAQINPMEKFLLQNEIYNSLVNNFDAEIIGDAVLRDNLKSMGFDQCEDDKCRNSLGERLNLDYLIQGELNKKNEFLLILNFFQQSTSFTFILELRAKTFDGIRKSLPGMNQLIRGVFSFEQQEKEVSKKKLVINDIDKQKKEIAADNALLDQQLVKTKDDIKALEKKISRIQRRLARLIKRNPELEGTYQDVLKLYLNDPDEEIKDGN